MHVSQRRVAADAIAVVDCPLKLCSRDCNWRVDTRFPRERVRGSSLPGQHGVQQHELSYAGQ